MVMLKRSPYLLELCIEVFTSEIIFMLICFKTLQETNFKKCKDRLVSVEMLIIIEGREYFSTLLWCMFEHFHNKNLKSSNYLACINIRYY